MSLFAQAVKSFPKPVKKAVPVARAPGYFAAGAIDSLAGKAAELHKNTKTLARTSRALFFGLRK